jgi:hypothetical protein
MIIHIVSIRCLYVTATFLRPAFTKLMASPCKTWARSSGMARVGMSLGAGRSWISSLPKVQKLAEHAWRLLQQQTTSGNFTDMSAVEEEKNKQTSPK